MPLLFTKLIRSGPGLNYAMGIEVMFFRAVFYGNLYRTLSPILCFINHGLVGQKICLRKKTESRSARIGEMMALPRLNDGMWDRL